MIRFLTRALGGAVLLGTLAEACTVPVFRYALDRWPADAYRLEAPDGWLESEAGKALRTLLAESETELEVVATESADAPARLLMATEEETVVWSGKLGESAPQLLTSPAREELANRLLAGESMVWVQVSSGDEAKDKAFQDRLKARLEYLDSVAAIPEQDPNDPESQLGPGPELKVGFSHLRVDRDDPKEAVFLKMLAGPGSELLTSGEPFAGVVFGRGRVLGAWNATDLDDEGVDEVSLFLLGACSCRVKFQNPGWDLGMAINWDTRLMEAQMAADKKLELIVTENQPGKNASGNSPAIAASEPEPVTVTFGEKVDDLSTTHTETTTVTFNLLWVGVPIAVVALFIGGFLVFRKSS